MNEAFVIVWERKVDGRRGRGRKAMLRDEAEALAAELNAEFPGIVHEAVEKGGVRELETIGK